MDVHHSSALLGSVDCREFILRFFRKSQAEQQSLEATSMRSFEEKLSRPIPQRVRFIDKVAAQCCESSFLLMLVAFASQPRSRAYEPGLSRALT